MATAKKLIPFNEALWEDVSKVIERDNLRDDYTTQGKTEYVSPRFVDLAVAVTELTIRDYVSDYKSLRKSDPSISHDEAIWILKPKYNKFFLESPFAALAVHNTDGEEILYTLQANLKRGFVA